MIKKYNAVMSCQQRGCGHTWLREENVAELVLECPECGSREFTGPRLIDGSPLIKYDDYIEVVRKMCDDGNVAVSQLQHQNAELVEMLKRIWNEHEIHSNDCLRDDLQELLSRLAKKE